MNFSMIKSIFLSILVILILIGCEKSSNCIVGNGISTNEERDMDEFNSVSIWGKYYQVYLHTGNPSENIILEGESNILPVVNPIIDFSKLDIMTLEDVCIEPALPVKLDLYSPTLTSIGLSGESIVFTDNIFSDYFRIYVYRGGHMEVKIITDSLVVDAFVGGNIGIYGTAKKGYFNINDGVMLHSYELKQDSCFLTVNGSANITVNVERYLNVKIDGSAIVYYAGEPDTVISQISGSGKIIKQ